MRRAALDETRDVRGLGVGISLNEQVDMIRLDRQPHNRPLILFCHLLNDCLEPIMNRSDQHLASSLRTKDDMVEDMMHTVLFVNIQLFHVGYYSRNNMVCQHIHPSQAPNKEVALQPRLESAGLSGALSCNRITHNLNRLRLFYHITTKVRLSRFGPGFRGAKKYTWFNPS